MSAHVLLNLLNELGKRWDARLRRASYRIFLDEFNKVINTVARMQDSINHMIQKSHFIVKNSPLENATFVWTSTHNVTK